MLSLQACFTLKGLQPCFTPFESRVSSLNAVNPGWAPPAPAGPHAAIRLSRHARMMRPHVPTQQTKCSPLLPTHHTSPSGRRLPPPSTHSASCVSPPTPLCSAEQQLATYATIKVSAYPQPCSTPHIKRATHYPPLAYLSPAQHSLGGPCTQMPTLKNAVESAVNLAERAIGVDIDKDGDIGVILTLALLLTLSLTRTLTLACLHD